jgi:VanZ family protein
MFSVSDSMPQLPDFRSNQQTRIAAEWLRAWWPALLWAGVITFASTDTFSSASTSPVLVPIVRWVYPAISSEHLEAIHLFVRKSAHFTEYFIFYVLLYRGIRGRRSGWRWSWGLAAWIIAAAYSVLDEIHQSFVASRTASPWDSLLDCAGALVALLCVLLFVRFMRLVPAK